MVTNQVLRVTSRFTAYDLVTADGPNSVAVAEAERGRYHIGDKVIATSSDHHEVTGRVTWVDDPMLRAYWLAD